MKESQIREHLSKGWIRCIVTFEIVGKPATHVEASLKEFIKNLHTDSRIVILQEEFMPAEEVDDGLYSAFAEEEMLIRNLETLTWLSINFSPASIEIIEPHDLSFESRDLTNWLNDLLAHLHEIGSNVRGSNSAVEHLTIAMNQLIKNAILLSLQQGEKDVAQLQESTGIYEEQLTPFLEHLVQKGKIREEHGRYTIIGKQVMLPVSERPIAPAIEGKKAPASAAKKKKK